MVLEIQASSKRTTVYGQDNTYGLLDISNCTEVELPYSKHCILIPVTVSHRLPDRGIIGAGSVVVKDIPSDSIAVGNPCRVIRRINTNE